jgi:hypothetical protein
VAQRVEQTNLAAEGPLTDPTRNFQRDASGRVIRGANGQPLTITTDALGISKLTRIERGVQVFANASFQRALGASAAQFVGFVLRSRSWGLNLARPKYTLRMNWNYRSRARQTQIAVGRSIPENAYNWGAELLIFDVSGEYRLLKNVALFASVRNLTNAPQDTETANPSTPPNARFRQRNDFDSLWTVGLKSSF